MRLILFDVDGTLVDCGGQVRPLFGAALEEVFGTAGDLDGYDFAGKTDPRIVLDLMTAAGIAGHAVQAGLPRMREAYLRRLEAGLRRESIRLLPAVADLLARLAVRKGLAIGLLTGNWERGARAKLGRVGLDGYFPFGAFGEDGAERADLVPAALARAAACRGGSFSPEETLIVGDSPLDVACARAHGARALAVATGRTPAAALAEAGADWVIADLGSAADCLPAFRESL
jgi:phosphoglycolate phosphatase-like HAD superfamily hydrolase